MVVRLTLGFLGLFHLLNGLVMLIFPSLWAGAVVHLAAPDHLHFHFITDIGLAFVLSGTALLLATRPGKVGAIWAWAGAAWPLCHGLFHLEEWIMDGPPRAAGDLVSEGIGVILAAALGAAMAWVRYHRGET